MGFGTTVNVCCLEGIVTSLLFDVWREREGKESEALMGGAEIGHCLMMVNAESPLCSRLVDALVGLQCQQPATLTLECNAENALSHGRGGAQKLHNLLFITFYSPLFLLIERCCASLIALDLRGPRQDFAIISYIYSWYIQEYVFLSYLQRLLPPRYLSGPFTSWIVGMLIQHQAPITSHVSTNHAYLFDTIVIDNHTFHFICFASTKQY